MSETETTNWPYSRETIAAAKAQRLKDRTLRLFNCPRHTGEQAARLGMRTGDYAKVLRKWPTVHPAAETITVGPLDEKVEAPAPVIKPLQLPAPSVIQALFALDDDNLLVWAISRDPAEVHDLFDPHARWIVIGSWVIEAQAVKAALLTGAWPDKDADASRVSPAVRRTDFDRQRSLLGLNAKELEANAA
ncbi:MAG: hypothetical protein AAFO80_08270 [Pseudomonadota bacterium]